MSFICKRISDGKYFVSSFPKEWSGLEAMVNVIGGGSYYFLGIEKIPKKWWHLKQWWRYTGEVWGFKEHKLFDCCESEPLFIFGNGWAANDN